MWTRKNVNKKLLVYKENHRWKLHNFFSFVMLQEIIQNAEDAGASCVKFIYNKNDYRQSHDTEYSVDGLRQYQVFVLLLDFLCAHL